MKFRAPTNADVVVPVAIQSLITGRNKVTKLQRMGGIIDSAGITNSL